MSIGKRIKEARKNLGYTQQDLANLIGVTDSAIANYEKGLSHPRENVLYRIMDVLHVDANYLFQDSVNTIKKTAHPTEENLMFALFGTTEGITDEMFEDVKKYARFVLSNSKSEREGK